ncbi:MAG: O-antigen ligase family protein [Lachnospiraceae bacterium]|nr:O-antigen ligase family protein [Lachnospiraceae bacterium]
MGPCLHSIGYGMMLFFLIAIACVDYEKDEVYLFKRPVLLCLLILNVFLTGSRGTLGIAVLEIMLIILFTRGERRKRTFFFLLVAAAGFGVFLLAVYNTSLGRYIMVQITSVIDEVFGTSLAVNYGADVTWLEQSSDYRTLLPKIFQVEWLNPLLGKGANAHITFAIDGRYLKSIDNYYVALYIRYSYPGLITAVLIHAASIFHMMRTGLKYKSGLSILCGISIFVYTISLYWVDYLMTTRYMYIIIAMYAVLYAERYLELDRANRKKKRIKKI